MNIFYLSHDPILAARMQCDSHVVKMTLESTQLLNNVLLPEHQFYKPTHMNHPCTLWLQESRANAIWLYVHACSLAYEYQRRFHKEHKCMEILLGKLTGAMWNHLPDIPMTTPALAMPASFHSSDPVESYRRYYAYKKLTLKRFTYTLREEPEWLAELIK